MRIRRTVALSLLVGLIAALGVTGQPAVAGADPVGPVPVEPVPAPHDHAAHGHGDHAEVVPITRIPPENRRRGMVYDGLEPADAESVCAGGYELDVAGRTSCTHGPDPAPPGVNLLDGPQPLPVLPADGPDVAAVPCIGDGRSGPRVEILYVRPAGAADKSATVVPQLKAWAGDIDEMVLLSALETGGQRRVRWATDSACSPVVQTLTIDPANLDFDDMLTELSGRGYTSPDRKYLVWLDADPGYCGLGQLYPDSRSGQDNWNNAGSPAMFAAVARSCWYASVGAHEVMHTFGAVQRDAPNASAYGHCTDDADLMCYADGAGTVVRQVCAPSHEDRLDCNNDDYFHTAPVSGSYLATHWNTANSRFFDGSTVTEAPKPPGGPRATPGHQSATVTWTPPGHDGGLPILGYTVTASPGGASVSAGADARSVTVTGLTNGTAYTFAVRALNRAGASGPATTPAVTPAPVITTIAGNGLDGPTGDGGQATAASLGDARDVAVDPAGNRYVATAGRIRKITPAGVISTVVGSATPTGTADGTPPLQLAVDPTGIAIGPGNVLYWADPGLDVVRKLQSGTVTTVAGTVGVPGFAGDGAAATTARLDDPIGLSVTAGGDLYVADSGNSRIRRISAGTITTVAGSDLIGGFAGDGGAATTARLNRPTGVSVAVDGTVYIADTNNHRIRRVSSGVITTVAGNGYSSGGTGTVPTSVAISMPTDVVPSGDGFLVAGGNCSVRQVAGGELRTVAGTVGSCGFAGDGGTATSARIRAGRGFTLDGTGRLLLADGANFRVRLVTGFNPAPGAAAPGAPPAVSVAPGHAKVTVSWVPPGNGGSPITAYRVVVSPGGTVLTPAAGATSVVVSNLTPGTSYTFSVQARNVVGLGAATVSPAAVPTRPPAAPTGVSATAGDGRALVTWTPAAAGTNPITGYRVVSSPGGVIAFAPAGTTRVLVPSLSTTTSYRFTVAAMDAGDTGPASALSNAVTPGKAAPFLSTDAFVRQGFKDFLGRAPFANELTSFRVTIDSGSMSRARFVETLASQGYVVNHVDPVGRLYSAYFLRLPDRGGLDYWVDLHRRGVPLGDIAGLFADSVEFRNTYGTLSNTAFVELIYKNVLQRASDPSGKAYWIGILNQGWPRGALMTGFSESDEYKGVMANEMLVVKLWRGTLAAMPTPARFTETVARLDAGESVHTIIDELLLDPAYAARITR